MRLDISRNDSQPPDFYKWCVGITVCHESLISQSPDSLMINDVSFQEMSFYSEIAISRKYHFVSTSFCSRITISRKCHFVTRIGNSWNRDFQKMSFCFINRDFQKCFFLPETAISKKCHFVLESGIYYL